MLDSLAVRNPRADRNSSSNRSRRFILCVMVVFGLLFSVVMMAAGALLRTLHLPSFALPFRVSIRLSGEQRRYCKQGHTKQDEREVDLRFQIEPFLGSQC